MADSDKSLYNLRYNQVTSNLEGFGGGTPQWTLVTLNNVDPMQVPITRQINTTAPLQGGGNLTMDRTLSIPAATNLVDGYLLATDWSTFNAKQVAGNYITGLTGDASASGPGAVPLTLATVNGSVGTFSYASITVNAKGLITSASSGTFGSLTDVGTDGITITNGTGAVVGAGTSIAQHVSDTSHNGYLSSSDWNTFSAKQPAGSYITALTGDVAASGPGSSAATLATVNANVGSFTYSSITVNAKGLITAASSGTAPVTSVSGTANQITSSGGTTPTLALASPMTTPGAITVSGNLTFTPTTNGIIGTPTNNNAVSGNVGEYIESVFAAVTSAATGTFFDGTSISLTAGDWDVTLNGLSSPFPATALSAEDMGISQSSGNSTTGLVPGSNWVAAENPPTSTANNNVNMVVASYRQSLSGTTTIYAKFRNSYSGTAPAVYGRLSARRIR